MKAPRSDRSHFIGYPTNRVVGTVADADKAKETVEALLRAGFDPQNIDVLHDEEDLHRLDLTGAEHGVLAQVQRTLIRALDLEQFKHLTHHVEDVQAGRYVIMVLAKLRAHRIVAADILHHYGAEFVGFYGRWAWEGLPAVPETSPDLMPSLFARAWNERDADALAALFDEDAVFVDVAGVRWHDRQSIRKAHAQRLADGGGAPLSVTDTTVKRISPDVALVQARMMRSDGGEEVVQPPGSHATIISFVVHRAGNGWLCASAHSTELVADQESAGAGAGSG